MFQDAKFTTKMIVTTIGVAETLKYDDKFRNELPKLITKHFKNEGDECKTDKRLNELSIKHKQGRVFSSFVLEGHRLFIVTEGLHLENDPEHGKDHPNTCIMLRTEY